MKLLSTFFFVFQAFFLFGQLPIPCPSNATQAADNIEDACVYCNFNGFQSSTAGYTADTLSGYCGTSENGQFIGFLAGESGVTITLIPSNSQNGDGLDFAIIDGLTEQIIACNAGASGNGSTPQSLTVSGLISGQYYFLFVDGYNGDICDFTVVASPPSAVVASSPSTPSNMSGQSMVCPNSTHVYSTPPISGASAYTWTAPAGALINGNPSPQTFLAANMGNIVTVEFADTPGDICVNGVNSCNGGQALCKQVRFEEFLTLTGDTVICQGAAIPSPFDTTYVTAGGCDSVVQFVTILMASPPTVLPTVNLCEGDSLLMCGSYYTQAGTYTDTCSASNGCDSLITFTINIPQFAEIVQGDSVECPMLPYTLTYVPGPGVPTWRKLGSTTALSNNLSVEITEYGTYIFELEYLIASEFCTEGDTIVIYCTSPTSEALAFEQNVQVRPSIGDGLFTISIEGEKWISALRVFDMQGRLLQHEKTQYVQSHVLDASTLQSGTYIVSILIDGKWVRKRIVKI